MAASSASLLRSSAGHNSAINAPYRKLRMMVTA
jgi:hypothetical protein